MTDDPASPTDASDTADADHVDASDTTRVADRLAELDATSQAVRGYLGGVDGLTGDVERQAALALAKAEAVEAHAFDADERLAVERLPTTTDRPTEDDSGGARPGESASLVERSRDVL